MQAKISKTLEAIIARTAFETSKRAITHSRIFSPLRFCGKKGP